ncbi:hypothetical protein F503_08752 [Ophiostoma piceae UAMH 11346]|uniref:Uncharacterized protein n=1 Tax=Ophiostoma piceae (strain UAMH 11346) TaxID=1262450 RepID=S3BQ77_OPHP1|nr:hypothetical protein F503_08752 [Ophiostoma piceae UAMH 11346]
MRPPITAGTPPSPRRSTGSPSTAASSSLHSSRSPGFDMPPSHALQPAAMSAVAPSSFSVVSADYAVPRAILAPHLSHAPPSLPLPHPSQPHFQLSLPRAHIQHPHPQMRRHPPPTNNPSVLHPVFFTNNFQRRQSFSQPAPTASTLHPAFMSSHPFPPAPPAPPLPHASSPVAHGYVYREAPPTTPPYRRGPNSKL